MKDGLAIIVGTINPPVLVDFFESVKKQKNKNFHVYLVDISETDTLPKLKSKHLTVILAKNKGYAHNVNIGLKRAIADGYEKFCVINDDTFFKDDFVERATTAIYQNPGSVIGGKIYYAPGYEYHKDRYVRRDLGNVIWYAGGRRDWDHAKSFHVGVDEVDNGQFNKKTETSFVTGALMLFDRSVVDTVGYWDESYFLYYEDDDYCVRAQRKGLKLVYVPTVVIWHKVSQSTGGSGSAMQNKYLNKNHLKFGLKYAPVRTKLHLLKNFFFAKSPTT